MANILTSLKNKLKDAVCIKKNNTYPVKEDKLVFMDEHGFECYYFKDINPNILSFMTGYRIDPNSYLLTFTKTKALDADTYELDTNAVVFLEQHDEINELFTREADVEHIMDESLNQVLSYLARLTNYTIASSTTIKKEMISAYELLDTIYAQTNDLIDLYVNKKHR